MALSMLAVVLMCVPAAAAKEQAAGQLLCEEPEPGPSGVGLRRQELRRGALLRQRPVPSTGGLLSVCKCKKAATPSPLC